MLGLVGTLEKTAPDRDDFNLTEFFCALSLLTEFLPGFITDGTFIPKKSLMSEIPRNKAEIILQAALKQFAENGFHSSPISQLATRAGVGVGSIYRYFKDKDALIHAVFNQVDAELQRAIVHNFDPGLPDQQQHIQLVVNLIAYLKNHPREFKFLEQYYSSPYGSAKKHAKFLHADVDEHPNPFVNLFASISKKAQRNLPLPLYLAMTFGPVIFILRDALSGEVVLDDALIQQTAAASWRAIGVHELI